MWLEHPESMSHCDSSECIGSVICFDLAMEAQCTSLVVECLDLITVCAFSVVFGVLIFVGWVFDLVVASFALVVFVLCFLFVQVFLYSSHRSFFSCGVAFLHSINLCGPLHFKHCSLV